MVEYHVSGAKISAQTAEILYIEAGLKKGHDLAELEAIWHQRLTSEEARDTIFEVSDYTLEIDAND